MLASLRRHNELDLVSHEKAREAAAQISSIGHNLMTLKLEHYLPPSSVTSLIHAINVHIVDVSSPCGDTSKQATLDLNLCMNVLESLQDNYASAGYAYRFLKVARGGLSTTSQFR